MSRCTVANFRRARRREAGWWRAARPAKKKPRIVGGALNFGTSDSATLVRERRLGVRRVRRILLDTADEIERGVKRLVVLRIRRDIGLRAGLLVAFGLEVSAQRSFAARVSARFELLGQLLQHLDVGLVLNEVARARIESLGFLGGAAARRHDLALLQESPPSRESLL